MNGCSIPRWAVAVAIGSASVLAWHAAIDAALIVPAPPGPLPAETPDATMAAFFSWLRSTAVHDLGVRVLGAASFLALAGLGRSLAALDPDEGPRTASWRSGMAVAGRLLIVAGLFGALGQLVELGGHQAAIAASGSLAPPATIGLIQYFVDQVAAAIATCAWAIFSVAALAGAWVTGGRLAVPGAVLGAALVVMVGFRLIEDPTDLAETLLPVIGLALIPLWALSILGMGTDRAGSADGLPA
jgi:hypothetical protein